MATEMSLRVGANIRARRKELGLKQRELAARFDSDAVNYQRISDWERGVNQPSERYLDELVRALEWDDVGPLYRPLGDTPDLMGAFNPNDRGEQLDHIERMLEDLVARGIAQEIGAAGASGEPRGDDSEEDADGSAETG